MSVDGCSYVGLAELVLEWIMWSVVAVEGRKDVGASYTASLGSCELILLHLVHGRHLSMERLIHTIHFEACWSPTEWTLSMADHHLVFVG